MENFSSSRISPCATARATKGGCGEDVPKHPALDRIKECGGERTAYILGAGVKRLSAKPYQRSPHDPLYRPLRIYTVDSATRRLDASVATVNVPYEPLQPGPEGCLFTVDNYDGVQNLRYKRADLDDKGVLIRDGYDPSPSDPRFHQQMVYAIGSGVYAAFFKALGRQITWGFDTEGAVSRLCLRPHAVVEKNAYYDPERGEIVFGYYKADDSPTDRTMPGSVVFTCLCHDIVTHEVTHALLDGLRARFREPSGPDVIAFHEAFADLVAVFQRFSYKEVVRKAIRTSRGDIGKASFLTELALQFGHTTGKRSALRSAIGESDVPKQYDKSLEPHDLGSVLVSAVFEAFLNIFKLKTERCLRLATQGSGILPPGELSADLLDELSEKASQLASQFLSICIRAIDYCPPVDLQFGEFLRAMITADYDLIPDDPWNYREALIDAFLRRKIYPRFVNSLTEDALLWRRPLRHIGAMEKLSFAELRFKGDPGCSAGPHELQRQACLLGDYVTRSPHMDEFGLVSADDPRLEGDRVSTPCIESVRSSRRVGPDGQIVFDLVAEITQKRTARDNEGREFHYYGGSTVILGPEGEIRYVISKSVVGEERLERRREFLRQAGQRYWRFKDGRYVPDGNYFRLLHSS